VAKRVSEITLGIDVSKDELVICEWASEQFHRVPNQADEIKAWLCAWSGPVRIAIEPTSSYHLNAVEQAHALGYAVFLVNPRQLAHYREAVNQRNKTDPEDAWLLARYLDREAEQLRPFKPLDPKAQQLWTLLKRRAVIVDARKQLKMSLADVKLKSQALFTQFDRLLKRIDQRLHTLIRALGWVADYRRCLSIPGIGHLNATALVAVYHRGAFASADAFVAFIGFDVRLRESGRFKGQRKLTKRGASEIRRLLYCATQPALCYSPFDRCYGRQLDKGLPKTAAKVILARKLARIAFALMTHEQAFNKLHLRACQLP